jgi:hypothetical protein
MPASADLLTVDAHLVAARALLVFSTSAVSTWR